MTQALALSLLQTGLPSMPMAGRMLPEFDLALATTLPYPPVPVVAARLPQGPAELCAQSVHTNMTLAEMVTVQPTLAARIPADAAKLLAANEATVDAVSNEMPIVPSIPGNVMRPRMAEVVARKAASPQPQSELGAYSSDKKPAVAAESDVLLTDKNDDAASTEGVATKADDVRVPVPPAAMPTVIMPALAEQALVRALPYTAPRHSRADDRKIDAGVAAALSPMMPRDGYVSRQSAGVQATNLSEEDASTIAATPQAVEPHVKGSVFESVLAISSASSPSAELRSVAVSPAYGLNELAGAQGVAERHLNLARDSMWLDQLATDIVSASDQTDHISFRLMPAHLGQLDVDLIKGNTGLSVNIATSTEEAGKIVASQQPSLVESLQAQGIRVADTQVTSGNDMSRHNQPQRHTAAHHLIDTANGGSDEPTDPNDERPDGRFA